MYDDMFVKCAVKGEADYLITDDIKSGMHVISHDHLMVITSKEFVHTYEKKYGMIK
jgi:predicted nucleic acid-binding protein